VRSRGALANSTGVVWTLLDCGALSYHVREENEGKPRRERA